MSDTQSFPDVAGTPLTVRKNAVRLQVRVQPSASANAIHGLRREADGTVSLHVAVTAPPEHDRANDALICLLSKAWKLKKTALSIAAGRTDRRKSVVIEGDIAMLSSHIARHSDGTAEPSEG